MLLLLLDHPNLGRKDQTASPRPPHPLVSKFLILVGFRGFFQWLIEEQTEFPDFYSEVQEVMLLSRAVQKMLGVFVSIR